MNESVSAYVTDVTKHNYLMEISKPSQIWEWSEFNAL